MPNRANSSSSGMLETSCRYSTGQGAEAATIEYAIQVLHVKQIVVCGRTRCGAMQGLLDLAGVSSLPAVRIWLRFSEPALVMLDSKYPDSKGGTRLNAAIKENVLLQFKHLRTNPSVAEGEAEGELSSHGWVYQFETGDVYALDSQLADFVSVRVGATGNETGQFASSDLF